MTDDELKQERAEFLAHMAALNKSMAVIAENIPEMRVFIERAVEVLEDAAAWSREDD